MFHIDGLVQERRNSSALAMELHLSCTNPSICNAFCHWLRSYSAVDSKCAVVCSKCPWTLQTIVTRVNVVPMAWWGILFHVRTAWTVGDESHCIMLKISCQSPHNEYWSMCRYLICCTDPTQVHVCGHSYADIICNMLGPQKCSLDIKLQCEWLIFTY